MPYLTPGGAMSGTLNQILSTRKAEARQALIDELNRKKVESSIRTDEESTRSMAEQRAAMTQARETAQVNEFGKQHEIGDDLSGVSPDLMKILQDRAMISPTPLKLNPQVTTSEAPQTGEAPTAAELDAIAASAARPPAPTQAGQYFRGLADQREQEKRREGFGNLISSGVLGDNSKMSLAERMATLANVQGDDKLPSAAYTALEPQGNLYLTSEATGKTSLQMGPDGKPISTGRQGNVFQMQNRPPQGPQGTLAGVTDDGSRGIVFQGGKFRTEPLPAGGLHPKPTNQRRPDILPPAIATQLGKYRDLAKPGRFNKPGRDRFTSYGNTALGIAEHRVSDPSVVQAIRQILANPQEARSNAEIVAAIAADPNTKPDELEDFTSLLFQVRR